ncbi:MAG: hypothetical protein IJM20_06265 [Clostridia bacterium]|jgi:hypothetical protein|nr:hypothetical protein [Clostridia bacterium]
MPDLTGILRKLLVRLIAAGLVMAAADALLPSDEKGGAVGGARRLIRLALTAAVLFRIPD